VDRGRIAVRNMWAAAMRSVVFASAVNDDAVFEKYLARSPDVATQGCQILRGERSAAGVNSILFDCNVKVSAPIVVYVHQDVFLPKGWLENFQRQWHKADLAMVPSAVAVAGIYGVKTKSPDPHIPETRAGHLLDRGRLLHEPHGLPCAVDSLDECLVAIDPRAKIFVDPALGWHFWATDLCLQAQARGLSAVVLDVYLEHWSTQSHSHLPASYAVSREIFRKKWGARLPIVTPTERVSP